MDTHEWKETFVEPKVTYTIELDGKFIFCAAAISASRYLTGGS